VRESKIQGKVVDYARKNGCIARKLDFGQGWPDYMFLHDGHVLFIEFKGEGGVVEPLQEFTHGLLRKHGFVVEVCEGILAGQIMIDRLVASVVYS
jgi:hypothetical protein